jgi:hydrogenase expression/formation protein HypD
MMPEMNDNGIKYLEEFRDRDLVQKITEKIRKAARGEYSFMEVCGGHTAAIHRFGIPSLLPDGIRLISGPGCPVCVTGIGFIDKAVQYSRNPHNIICTFGDMIRVPGSESSLEKRKSEGADVRIVMSGLDALRIAELNPDKEVIFLGIGFETTAPGSAVTILTAQKRNIVNFRILVAHKVMPPAMRALITGEVRLDGFICPGHVATITGSSAFEFIPREFGLGCVVAGFEPVDILLTILLLIKQVNSGKPTVDVEYSRSVGHSGNLIAQARLSEVFEPCDTVWRGLGTIPGSGLKLRQKFEMFDADKSFPLIISSFRENRSCICGKILKGLSTPEECTLFGTVCTPENPVGACMVSAEGACNVYYRYNI